MNVVFMGTSEFSVVCLNGLVDSGFNVLAVFTKPDKPVGRKQILEFPAVKKRALELKIPVYQPEKFGLEEENIIKQLEPEVVVVVAYGKLLPKNILNMPRYGCVNIHASLLPKYRGAAPIQACLINCEKVTGVTAMYMDEKLDAGDIIKKVEIELEENDTTPLLFDKLSKVGAKLIVEVLKDFEDGIFNRVAQNESEASYVSVLSKKIARIDFNLLARQVHGLICGLLPWPCAHCFFNGKILKIYGSVLARGFSGKPGEVLSNERFIVGCKEGAVEFLEVQLEGRKKMLARDFLNGARLKIGDFLE